MLKIERNLAAGLCEAGGTYRRTTAMMLFAEFGASEADSTDEIICKKLTYIEQGLSVVNKDIASLKSKPPGKNTDYDLSFLRFAWSRYQSEKSETLRNIGHTFYSGVAGGCHCSYCTRVICDRSRN